MCALKYLYIKTQAYSVSKLYPIEYLYDLFGIIKKNTYRKKNTHNASNGFLKSLEKYSAYIFFY